MGLRTACRRLSRRLSLGILIGPTLVSADSCQSVSSTVLSVESLPEEDYTEIQEEDAEDSSPETGTAANYSLHFSRGPKIGVKYSVDKIIIITFFVLIEIILVDFICNGITGINANRSQEKF